MPDQPTLQPFFDSLGQTPAPHAHGVNTAATARMERVLKSPVDAPGRGILLRAPRAGYGKTHLLSHVQQLLGKTHEFLPLNPLDGSKTDAAGAIENTLRRLTRALPAGGGLTDLDLLARRIFALALQPLVTSGEVPCQDREAALSALRQRPVETFDFHHSQAVTAHWTKENFEVLGPRLALELSRRTGTSLNESSFWLASLFRFAIAVPEHPGRTGMIIQAATTDARVERYAALLAMLSLIVRVVVVADDLEGMHADPQSALRFSSFLASLRQDAPRVDTIVSINDDIWESAFVPALSGGLLDRLGETEIRLEPLDASTVASLLEARLPSTTAGIAENLTLAPGEFYARKILRKAAQWKEEQEAHLPASETAQIAAPAPSPTPAMNAYGDTENVEQPGEPPSPFSPQEPEDRPFTPPPATFVEPESPAERPWETVAPATQETETPFERLEPQRLQEEPAAHATPPRSPFQIAEPETEAVATENPADATEPSGGDRIDDLLRQFRERYGRE